MVSYTLKAGGMELPPAQLKDALVNFMTGDGRFNWIVFCNEVEAARNKSWGEASRLKTAKLFHEIDADGSGKLGKDELGTLLKRMNIKVTDDHLAEMFQSFDEDGDGNLDFSEFLDGLATNMVTPSPVWDKVQMSHRGPKKLGGVSARPGLGTTRGSMSPRNTGGMSPRSPRVTPGFSHG